MVKKIMFQGTGSDVGKSLIVAGLARNLHRQNIRVAPFKPQNMSNNACACPSGGEIGRAQALQARAAMLQPHSDMNPILLKPEPDHYCQIIVQGKFWRRIRARDYHQYKPQLLEFVLESYHRLAQAYDFILCEGAGSPAEINLRKNDIANMGFAHAANMPVILIGDIDRGGVIAAIAGTRMILDAPDASMIKGFIINKFRGDQSLFQDALVAITQRSAWPSLGVIPWFDGCAKLPAEDTLGLPTSPTIDPRAATTTATTTATMRIAVPRCAHISNFDDLDPLRIQENVEIIMCEHGTPLPHDADLILLLGSKSTRADLQYIKSCGWDHDIHAHARRKKPIIGLCGGYQMLGQRILDPHGIEGTAGEDTGLGLLQIETIITKTKTVTPTNATDIKTNINTHGYEIHCGQTTGLDCNNPWLRIAGRPEGAISPDGLIKGCYLHGIFASDDFRHHLLQSLRADWHGDFAYDHMVETTLDELADHIGRAIDMKQVFEIAINADSA